MLFPIGDDQVQGGYTPYISYGFIALNVLIFVYQVTLPAHLIDDFILTYGSIPAETMRGEDTFTLLTSMFLHGGYLHIIGNMLFLWVFADNIEAIIGSSKFLVFYFLGGMAAHAAHIMFNMDSTVPTVGASGAISAVMGAYLVMFPSSRVKLIFFPLIFIRFRIPAFLFLGFWIYQQSLSGIASISETASGGVAWWAHIGGFVFGVLAGFYYRNSENLDPGYVSEPRFSSRDYY